MDKNFFLEGEIKSGFPSVGLPPTSTQIGNTTYTFLDMCAHLGSGIIVVPLVSLLGNIAIAKAFGNFFMFESQIREKANRLINFFRLLADGKIIDATQEMMTLGLCNIVGSFFSSIPVSGAFSRSAVNNASGVRTPLGGFYTGLVVLLALSLLTPYFYYIPKATLASVIVCAVVFMIEVKLIGHIWKTNSELKSNPKNIKISFSRWILITEKDLVPFFFTFAACLWQGVEVGILSGLSIDILYLLYVNARPKFGTHKVKVRNKVELNFPNELIDIRTLI